MLSKSYSQRTKAVCSTREGAATLLREVVTPGTVLRAFPDVPRARPLEAGAGPPARASAAPGARGVKRRGGRGPASGRPALRTALISGSRSESVSRTGFLGWGRGGRLSNRLVNFQVPALGRWGAASPPIPPPRLTRPSREPGSGQRGGAQPCRLGGRQRRRIAAKTSV